MGVVGTVSECCDDGVFVVFLLEVEGDDGVAVGYGVFGYAAGSLVDEDEGLVEFGEFGEELLGLVSAYLVG